VTDLPEDRQGDQQGDHEDETSLKIARATSKAIMKTKPAMPQTS
jgi:hypothetical protein